jgi:hypothetical protein
MSDQHNAPSEQKESTAKYWLLFLVSTALLIFMMIFVNEWFWVVLPFSLTSLVKALRVI